ncbi:NUDIX domain-containing protein [Chitinophaga sancti]|uniref:Bifunctional NMN adenylyltransferase/nudix hydrolase n=1 Tax=Chitinophaga sancti TaxID=1004 RepID=A0A1K1NZI9_9BACT|nr:NUDIX domain-containing protein [Chitinophaga sancti]WQD60335.1 NUDIX domain-containing protein [Chitinophaga sancti]WQG87537.1 NUDIX domain-containing protein [Chitinophaga sancti]SFW40743.1 bifunctional NMN adenylyltransferase/nudix hydrolase [Chitinophaga sancti]
MTTLKPTGVIIARFQTPSLHEGHLELIRQVKQKHNRLIIVLGVSPVKGSRKNPLDYYTRERMIKQLFPDVIILPQSDQADDKVWSQKLDELLSTNFPHESFVLYGSRDSFIPYYHGRYSTNDLPPVKDYNATALREAVSDKVFDTEEFRAGIIYNTYNQFPKVYPTVDIAVFRNNRSELLVGRKPAENAWRLPGGFTDPGDNCFDIAARRELQEECGQLETSAMQYECSMQMDDWRYRSEVDKIITTLFSTDLIFGEPDAADDIAALRWIPVNEIKNMIANGEIVPVHIPLLERLAEKYSTNA